MLVTFCVLQEWQSKRFNLNPVGVTDAGALVVSEEEVEVVSVAIVM